MALTGDIFKALTFDGESSRDYGVYITGQAVYNAPERDVEMVTIPGRSGAFALDKGRFENIEVTYPAGVFANTESDFARAISDFRNILCSRVGYCRLTDEYNPDEYRLAAYKSGLEVDPVRSRAGQFDITFECKPQRCLTSGETKTVVSDGDTITNPTLFASSPLIEAKGYGDITFNGHTITLQDGTVGTVNLWNNTISYSINGTFTKQFQTGLFNPTDTFSFEVFTVIQVTETTTPTVTNTNASATNSSSSSIGLHQVALPCTFTVSTSGTATNTCTYDFGSSKTVVVNMTCTYDASTGTVNYISSTSSTGGIIFVLGKGCYCGLTTCNATSTLNRLGNPTYIDCDLGEAYKINDGEVIGLNQFIDLGSKLPELAPGANTFTISNTFTEVAVVPRWWKV